MQMFSRDDIEKALSYPALVDILEAAFRAGAIAPQRHHHTIELEGRPSATLLLMPAWTTAGEDAVTAGSYAGVKIVTVFPDNGPRLGLPAIQGLYVLLSTGSGRPTRVHGPLVASEETEAVLAFVREQAEPAYIAAAIEALDAAAEGECAAAPGPAGDGLYERAVALVVRDCRASVGVLGRRLGIGRANAADLIARMQDESIIGPADASGWHDVLGPAAAGRADNAPSVRRRGRPPGRWRGYRFGAVNERAGRGVHRFQLGPWAGIGSSGDGRNRARPGAVRTAWRRGRDSNPRYPCEYAAFRVRCFQPLSHFSAAWSALLARGTR